MAALSLPGRSRAGSLREPGIGLRLRWNGKVDRFRGQHKSCAASESARD